MNAKSGANGVSSRPAMSRAMKPMIGTGAIGAKFLRNCQSRIIMEDRYSKPARPAWPPENRAINRPAFQRLRTLRRIVEPECIRLETRIR